jgi:hypothetical protein
MTPPAAARCIADMRERERTRQLHKADLPNVENEPKGDTPLAGPARVRHGLIAAVPSVRSRSGIPIIRLAELTVGEGLSHALLPVQRPVVSTDQRWAYSEPGADDVI